MNSQEFIKKAVKNIKISGFEDGEEIEVKVKKPSLLHIMSYGNIPNPLMETVRKIFEKKLTKSEAESVSKQDEVRIIDVFISGTLVEPTYDEIKEYLTDDQRNEIFTFAVGGLKAVESFRTEQTNAELSTDGEDVPEKTE